MSPSTALRANSTFLISRLTTRSLFGAFLQLLRYTNRSCYLTSRNKIVKSTQLPFVLIAGSILIPCYPQTATRSDDVSMFGSPGAFLAGCAASAKWPAPSKSNGPGDPSQPSCAPGREPFGGLLGLTDSLSSARTSKGYALLSGNNFPKDFVVPGGTDDPHATFWSSLRNLDAQVIALGQDDLLRAILPA